MITRYATLHEIKQVELARRKKRWRMTILFQTAETAILFPITIVSCAVKLYKSMKHRQERLFRTVRVFDTYNNDLFGVTFTALGTCL